MRIERLIRLGQRVLSDAARNGASSRIKPAAGSIPSTPALDPTRAPADKMPAPPDETWRALSLGTSRDPVTEQQLTQPVRTAKGGAIGEFSPAPPPAPDFGDVPFVVHAPDAQRLQETLNANLVVLNEGVDQIPNATPALSEQTVRAKNVAAMLLSEGQEPRVHVIDGGRHAAGRHAVVTLNDDLIVPSFPELARAVYVKEGDSASGGGVGEVGLERLELALKAKPPVVVGRDALNEELQAMKAFARDSDTRSAQPLFQFAESVHERLFGGGEHPVVSSIGRPTPFSESDVTEALASTDAKDIPELLKHVGAPAVPLKADEYESLVPSDLRTRIGGLDFKPQGSGIGECMNVAKRYCRELECPSAGQSFDRWDSTSKAALDEALNDGKVAYLHGDHVGGADSYWQDDHAVAVIGRALDGRYIIADPDHTHDQTVAQTVELRIQGNSGVEHVKRKPEEVLRLAHDFQLSRAKQASIQTVNSLTGSQPKGPLLTIYEPANS